MARYDELERLQRLRESGALSDEEFEAEKRRVLADPEPAPAPAAEPTPGDRPNRMFLYAVLGILVLTVAIIAGVWLGRDAGGGSEVAVMDNESVAAPPASDENLLVAEAPPGVQTLPQEEQLARAFEAAFGKRGSASVRIETEDVAFTPGRLLWAPFGPVLVSEGQAKDAAHASAGQIAIHYLTPSGDSFKVVKRFVPAITTGSFGRVGEWNVNTSLGDRPIVYAEGGGTWQGYTCASATLTELSPGKPIDLATIPIAYSDAGAQEDESQATEIDGKIANIVKGRSFDVVYSGSEDFTEHYVRQGNAYVLTGGETRMRGC